MSTVRSRFILVLALAFASWAVAQSTKSADTDLSMPEGNGVFVRSGAGGWIKLERAKTDDSKAHGMGRFLETDGLSGLNMTLEYHGTRAAIQISERRPTFHVRGIGSAKEALIVQLTRKKDSREVKIDTTEASSDNKVGFKRGEIRRVATASLSKTAFTVVPDLELKPGEYLLVLGDATAIFDFGVSPSKN